MKLRWGIVGGTVALSLALILGAYWWYRQREPARDGAPNWTPDGQSLVFSAEVGARKGDVFLMRADGTDRENLTEDSDANEGSPAMSPDGQHIAFESDRDGNVEIYVMNRNKSGVRRLTKDPAEDRSPAWSPDGSRIVFMSDRGGRVSPDLYTMKADGSDVQRLTTEFSNWAPQYSPDGRQIAFQLNRDVHVLDLASAHVLAIRALLDGAAPAACNLGNGRGTSVREIMTAFEQLQIPVPHDVRARRAGDPARLIADTTAARTILGWTPQYTEIEAIIRSAYAWHSAEAARA